MSKSCCGPIKMHQDHRYWWTAKKLRINLERMRSTIRQFQEVTSFRSVIRSPSASGAMMRIFAFSVSKFVARFVTLTALDAATWATSITLAAIPPRRRSSGLAFFCAFFLATVRFLFDLDPSVSSPIIQRCSEANMHKIFEGLCQILRCHTKMIHLPLFFTKKKIIRCRFHASNSEYMFFLAGPAPVPVADASCRLSKYIYYGNGGNGSSRPDNTEQVRQGLPASSNVWQWPSTLEGTLLPQPSVPFSDFNLWNYDFWWVTQFWQRNFTLPTSWCQEWCICPDLAVSRPIFPVGSCCQRFHWTKSKFHRVCPNTTWPRPWYRSTNAGKYQRRACRSTRWSLCEAIHRLHLSMYV